MSRRPSVASLSSIGSGLLKPISLPTVSETGTRPQRSFSNGSLVTPSRSVSYTGNLDTVIERNSDGWDPDELFTKHTVAEVKAIQHRLRADADAKQEELRLMVGERYRDLLQASTSIISIAKSSDNVLVALDEVRSTTSSIRPKESAQAATRGQADEHLQALQSLAAHLKLLLDAPEHLWRLIERKLYLHAAWLFLLSRVVHRSLLRDEGDEDITWHTLGIHISEQFPIVQRQWDAVSQFRSQISHKATMALREQNSSPPEVCAILLTLHLLESRPLPETLATFLAQRTRSLTTSLNRPKERTANGSAADPTPSQDAKPTKSGKVVVREVRQKLKAALDIVVRTMGISRTVFIRQTDNEHSLMQDVLRHIQEEAGASSRALPNEIRLTSQTLLSSLPSSNHFLLLPVTIRTYKPYVDGSALLSGTQGIQYKTKLGEWFGKAMKNVQAAMDIWFAEFSTIHDLWEVRRWCGAWLQSTKGLDTQEILEVEATLNTVCRQHALRIWKAALTASEVAFRERLASALDTVAEGSNGGTTDSEPVRYLFHSDTAPSISHSSAGSSSNGMSFQKFRDSLRLQMAARTPSLHGVLSTVENSLKDLRTDLNITQESDINSSGTSATPSVQDYVPDAESLCVSLCTVLQSKLDGLSTLDDIHQTIFIGRIAKHLSTSSVFIESICFSQSASEELRARLYGLYEQALERWQQYTVTKVILAHWGPSSGTQAASPKPSARLLDTLLILTSAIAELGILAASETMGDLVRRLLHYFVVALLRHLDIEKDQQPPLQTVWDMAFLLVLVETWESDDRQTRSLVLSSVLPFTQKGLSADLRRNMSEWLSRVQVLFGLLLPATVPPPAAVVDQGKPSSLLQLGVPLVETQYQPAFDLVKPSARFGLLLVGSSAAR
ncbi:hypothetical protein BDW22DRAFT_1319545 [Trametopsis cervina]|nr:hypothetical protein BDW22DRAFT_1319545 [Trametopsis cervina]